MSDKQRQRAGAIANMLFWKIKNLIKVDA